MIHSNNKHNDNEYVCMYVCMYIYISLSIYIYIYIHTHVHTCNLKHVENTVRNARGLGRSTRVPEQVPRRERVRRRGEYYHYYDYYISGVQGGGV